MGQSKRRDDQLFAAPCEFHDTCEFGGPVTAEEVYTFSKSIDAFGGGIALGVNDAAHTLKKYNKGVAWLPKIQDASFSNGEGVTYDVQLGTFTEIGNRVFFEAHIKLTSVGSLFGVINIVNFPVPMKAGGFAVIGVNQGVGLNLAGAFVMSGRLDPATQSIRLQQMSSNIGVTDVTPAQFSDTGEIKISGNYIAAKSSALPEGFPASQTLDFTLNTAVPGGTPDDVLTVFRPGAPENAFPENLAGDAVTLILPGLLIRTDAGLYVHSIRANNMKSSQDFTNKWTLRGSPLVNDQNQLAPDGTITASTMAVGAAGVKDFFQQVNGFPAATQFEPSFFIKRVTTSGVFRIQKVSSADSQTGQWDVDMALLPDTYIRLTANHPAVTVVELFISDISAFTFTGMHFFTPDGVTRTFDIWGVQLEAKGGVSPYILTEGDFSTSILFSEITQPTSQMGFGADQGTIVIDAVMPPTTVVEDAFVFSISDGAEDDSLTLSRVAGVWAVKHTIAGTSSSQVITGITDDTSHKIAFGWQADGKLNVSVDGGLVQTFTTHLGQDFTPEDDFNLGSHPDGQFNLDSTIQSLTSYADYSDALLQARSTQIRS